MCQGKCQLTEVSRTLSTFSYSREVFKSGTSSNLSSFTYSLSIHEIVKVLRTILRCLLAYINNQVTILLRRPEVCTNSWKMENQLKSTQQYNDFSSLCLPLSVCLLFSLLLSFYLSVCLSYSLSTSLALSHRRYTVNELKCGMFL